MVKNAKEKPPYFRYLIRLHAFASVILCICTYFWSMCVYNHGIPTLLLGGGIGLLCHWIFRECIPKTVQFFLLALTGILNTSEQFVIFGWVAVITLSYEIHYHPLSRREQVGLDLLELFLRIYPCFSLLWNDNPGNFFGEQFLYVNVGIPTFQNWVLLVK